MWAVGAPCPWGLVLRFTSEPRAAPWISWCLSFSLGCFLQWMESLRGHVLSAQSPQASSCRKENGTTVNRSVLSWVELVQVPVQITIYLGRKHFIFFLTALGVTDLWSAAYAGGIWFDAHPVFCPCLLASVAPSKDALAIKNLSASLGDAETRFNPWVGKIPWRREWQPTPVFLLGASHGQRSLAGHSPWDHKESDTAEVT